MEKYCFFAFMMLLPLSAFAIEADCFITDKSSVKCDYYLLDDEEESVTGFYTMRADGSWMSKHYVVEKSGTKRVHVSDRIRPGKWPCVVDPVTRTKYMPPDSVGPGCEDSGDYFVERIKSGDKMYLPYFDETLQNFTRKFVMVCDPYKGVTTWRFNKKTDLKTDMHEYGSLRKGTYCEDFVATDALYWKP